MISIESKTKELDDEIEKLLSPTSSIKEYFLTNGCENIYKHLSKIVYLKSTGVSETIILFGILNYKDIVNQNIVLKIAFEPKNKLNNSSEVEEEIYRNVISNLLDNNHTPHLIKYIASIKNCKINFSDLDMNKDDIKEIMKEINNLSRTHNINNSIITILSKTSGNTLFSMINKLTDNEQLISIFQILYTLMCFNNITLKHNDLHLSNIFVETDNKNIFNYKINDKIISITTNINCKIYDFDRSTIYHPSVKRNLEIDIEYCDDFYQCSDLNKEFDLQSFIAGLITNRSKLKDNVKKYITLIVLDEFIDEVDSREYQHI